MTQIDFEKEFIFFKAKSVESYDNILSIWTEPNSLKESQSIFLISFSSNYWIFTWSKLNLFRLIFCNRNQRKCYFHKSDCYWRQLYKRDRKSNQNTVGFVKHWLILCRTVSDQSLGNHSYNRQINSTNLFDSVILVIMRYGLDALNRCVSRLHCRHNYYI